MLKMNYILLWVFFQAFSMKVGSGFVPSTRIISESRRVVNEKSILKAPVSSLSVSNEIKFPTSLGRQRYSVARVQTMGIFGLGAAEIAIIVAVGAFLIGPEQIGKMLGGLKGAADGGISDELRKIPEEFKKGIEEGEANARARNAKQMEKVKDDE